MLFSLGLDSSWTSRLWWRQENLERFRDFNMNRNIYFANPIFDKLSLMSIM